VTQPRLGQSQIDQLIAGVRSGKVPTGKGSLTQLLRARRLDFSDPTWGQDRIVRRRLPVLDLIFDRLGPLVQITLTKNLRFPVRIENEGIELQKFGDFRARHGEISSLFEITRLDPLRGTSMIVFERSLLYALIDALMGGLGVGTVPTDRDISEIEVSLLQKTRLELFRDFENAWKPWFPMSVEHVRSDRNISVVSSLSDEEVCHVGRLMISGDVLARSPIFFILPYTSLEPLFDATSPQSGEDLDPNWKVNLETNLRDVALELSAVLGSVDLPATRITSLRPGDVIELETHANTDIDVCVEAEPVFRARIGQNHLQYAFKVSSRRTVEREVVDRTAGQQLVRKGLISREQLQVARVDERINRRPLLESIVARGWVERRVLESALGVPV
jgi:flagellar motor switch protein FliM